MTAALIILVYLSPAEELRLAASHQHQMLLVFRHTGGSPSHTQVTQIHIYL